MPTKEQVSRKQPQLSFEVDKAKLIMGEGVGGRRKRKGKERPRRGHLSEWGSRFMAW